MIYRRFSYKIKSQDQVKRTKKEFSVIKGSYRLKIQKLINIPMRTKLILITVLCLILMQTKSLPNLLGRLKLNSIRLTNKTIAIPQKIFAAQIHYSRIPHQYWEHRLKMVKGMGFNAISVYIMWNFHELEEGKFEYENGDKNLRGFLDLAKKQGLMVLLRPGPYVCAEWDFGGLPARLLSIKGLEIRANNKLFLDQVKKYFASLIPIINEFSVTNSGPIIMLQIQNEYGWYGTDKNYIQAIRFLWQQVKVPQIPQYYVDWFENIEKSHWEDANVGLNNGIKEQWWVQTRKMEPKGYIIGGEIYSGWLTHWGENWAGKTVQEYTKEFDFLMTNNHSFSMYMAHGGSNFGLWAGANGVDNKAFDYGAHITSYDYDAPINQQGSPNQKYHIFRELAQKHAIWNISQIPPSIPTMTIKQFIPGSYADLLLNLDEPALKGVNELVPFEDERLKMWNQGFLLYSTNLAPGNYSINLTVHDFALVYINGEFVKALDRSERTVHTINFSLGQVVNHLQILVEAMGHINFSSQMLTDYKGIINFTAKFTPISSKIFIDQQPKIFQANDFSWDITKVPIDNKLFEMKTKSSTEQFPRLFRYNLALNETSDTYLNMEGWQKGYVFVNGVNLGRYWNKGPQQKLFLPGVWLKKGENEVVVLELLTGKAKFIRGDQTLKIINEKMDDEVQAIKPELEDKN